MHSGYGKIYILVKMLFLFFMNVLVKMLSSFIDFFFHPSLLYLVPSCLYWQHLDTIGVVPLPKRNNHTLRVSSLHQVCLSLMNHGTS